MRCFAGEHRLRIRPLTFLVGENSTGKSTVLGCMQAMGSTNPANLRYSHNPDFNEQPWKMGSFREIVRKSRPLKESFSLALTLTIDRKESVQYRITLKERGDGPEPVIDSQEWRFSKGSIRLVASDWAEQHLRQRKTPFENEPLKFERKQRTEDGCPLFVISDSDRVINSVRPILLRHLLRSEQSILSSQKEFIDFVEHLDLDRMEKINLTAMQSIAPVRAEPRRTYDPVAELPDATGADIPMYFINMAREYKEAWRVLREELISFGKDSGLFKDIQVKQLGKSGSNPFQIRVKVSGPEVNLIDTGYGISQALPIVVDVLRSRNILLVQQPEVHLHPRGQAALASLLVQRLNQKQPHPLPGCVIETHSDYMLKRARIEIRRGHISPDDVSLIYLEKKDAKGVQTHNITFDEQGNIENVPPEYGQFFLQESDRFLGFSE